MLKKRIIPILLLNNNRLLKSVNFNHFRDVGDPVSTAKVYNSQYADELIFLNINREDIMIDPLIKLIEKVSEVCFMPLAVGGGIRSYDEAAYLIQNGADKIVLNSICYNDLSVITKVSKDFGSQAVVVCIDVRFDKNIENYWLFSHAGRQEEKITLDDHLQNCIQAGAGEVLIQSIDRDGTMSGFDIGLIKRVANQSSVPVIACGGSGHYEHLKDVFVNTNINAVACGSIFNFSDSNLIRTKAFLSNYGIPFKII